VTEALRRAAPLARYEQLRIGTGRRHVMLVRTHTQREVSMEHRWGIRRTLNIGVTMYVESKFPSFGWLLNASSSGAYLATSVTLPLMARVHMALGWDASQRNGRRRIAAHVVRASDGGM